MIMFEVYVGWAWNCSMSLVDCERIKQSRRTTVVEGIIGQGVKPRFIFAVRDSGARDVGGVTAESERTGRDRVQGGKE